MKCDNCQNEFDYELIVVNYVEESKPVYDLQLCISCYEKVDEEENKHNL